MYLRLRSPGSAALSTLLLGLSAAANSTLAQSAGELPPIVVEADADSKTEKKPKKATGAQDYDGGFLPPEGMIVESPNRTPMEAAKVGSSVAVVTAKDLQKQSKTFVKDYLDQLTGVHFSQNGPPGTLTGISIRGASVRYVKVLVDGIDVSDPSGSTTETHFEHLLVGDVSRIELLKGSQSTLYGGDAVGGVISIETKAATTPGFSHGGNTEYGAYNTYRGAYTAGYAANDGSNIAFTVQGIETDGFSAASAGTEDDGYRNLTISGRGEQKLSESLSVFFAARTLDARSEFDFASGDTDAVADTVQHAGRAGVNFALLGGHLENTIAVQGMEVMRDYSYGSWFDGDRVKGEYKSVLTFNDRLALLAGGDWERVGIENVSVSRATADIAGAYAQLMMEPVDGLTLTGGARIDDHNAFGKFHTHRLTGAYLVPGTETKFHSSLGTGFRAPSLDELYGDYGDWGFGPFQYGNPNLKPEESMSWDVGVDQGLFEGRLRLGATYFEIDTENLIQYVPTDYGSSTGCGVPGYICNINVAGVTQRRGLELSGIALLNDWIALSAGYTYIDTETASGLRLARVPGHTFVAGIDVQPIDKLELNLTTQYVTDTVEIVSDAPVPLDDYFLVSAKAAYAVAPGWKAYVRGENLLDEDYETTRGFSTAGLSIYGGLQMSLPED